MINIDTINNLFYQFSNQFSNQFTTNLFNDFNKLLTTPFTRNLFNKINDRIINSKLTDHIITTGLTIAFGLTFAPTFTKESVKLGLKISLIMAPIIAKFNMGILGLKTVSEASNYIIQETLAQLEKLSSISNDWATLYNKMRNLFVENPHATTIIQDMLAKGPFSNIIKEAAHDPEISVAYNLEEQLCKDHKPNCVGHISISVKTPIAKQKPSLLFSLKDVRNKLHEVKNDQAAILCNIKEEFSAGYLTQNLSCDSLEYKARKSASFRYA